jgi:hypothetical protein
MLFLFAQPLCANPSTTQPNLNKETPASKKNVSATTNPADLPVPDRAAVVASIRRGVDFLLKSQKPDGSWGGPRRTKELNIYAPAPGAHLAFKAGASGLALTGLIDANDSRPEVQAAIDRAETWMVKNLPRLRRPNQTTTYNNWGHAYGLRALCAMARRAKDNPKRLAELRKLAQQQVDFLNRYEDVNGGWGYLDFDFRTRKPSGSPTAFMTGTVLLAMHEARETLGVKLDDKTVRHAIASVLRQRTPDFCYVYSLEHWKAPRLTINEPAGSLGRTQTCNAALRVFGDKKITDDVLAECTERFLRMEPWLALGRKRPVPHESKYKIAGYFYYYGIFYFSESARLLPAARQTPLARRLAAIIVNRQEPDGSWWDYPLYEYHQPYGTGYALMALTWCRNAGWAKKSGE